MPAGQGVLATSLLDVGELDGIGDRIEARERDRSVQHAEQLIDALALDRTLAAAGMELSTAAQLALLMGCSEYRANTLLAEAKVLHRLGALEPMRQGLMTVEQARVVSDLLGTVADDELAASLWERLHDRLATDQQERNVRPPARLRELLRGWLIAADPDGHVERQRTDADDTADVELWKRDNGLVDLVIRSLSAADAQACVDQVEQRAQPSGPEDDRSAGMRRRDAARGLLLGRSALTFDPDTGEVADACCPPGSSAPCGANVFVHVHLDTALEESTVPAELVGHGPIDPAALRDLLLAQPVLHRVWVDGNGIPVAVDDRTWRPGRGDPDALRKALHDMRDGPPPEQTHARHPDDHDHSDESSGVDAPRPTASRPSVLARPHLADPGAYRPTQRQKRLLRARARRCEWPGCGRRASRAVAAGCDLDHDLAWPFGPTCACNLGPLCRRHHRIKQLGWLKHRRVDGSVRWTGPTGRTWTSPTQHDRPRRAPRRERAAPGVWRLAA
ncbi:MAG: hypothetical protein QOE05_2185 [Actinomycetota bacterium]|jgi:hypothetical protein|nr:hypothetical protein [Actinomycetota bacterium]